MRIFASLLVVLFLAACSGQPAPKEEPAPAKDEVKVNLEDKSDKLSYAIGLDIATKLKQSEMPLNPEIMAQALLAGWKGEKTLMTPNEAMQALMAYQQEEMAKQQEEAKKLAEKNKEAGKKFLEENKGKEGVKTTESGLQYKVLEEGKGESPKMTDKVKVHYRGKLIDGTEFDSSYSRNQPATFPMNGVIEGMTEALALMKPGSKMEVVIPSELAYGDRQAGPQIGPGSVLIFDLELLEVSPADEQPKK